MQELLTCYFSCLCFLIWHSAACAGAREALPGPSLDNFEQEARLRTSTSDL